MRRRETDGSTSTSSPSSSAATSSARSRGLLARDRHATADALRSLAVPGGESGRFVLPDESRRLTFPQPEPGDDASFAGEASVLAEVDGIVRAEQRVEALEHRLASLERGPLSRLRGLAG